MGYAQLPTAKVLAALDEDEPRYDNDVAKRLGVCKLAAYVTLHRLSEDGVIGRSREPEHGCGGICRWMYYLLPPEQAGVVPLYEKSAGYSAIALARCLGGYTFPKRDTLPTST